MKNNIPLSIVITPEDMDLIKGYIQNIRDTLPDNLINLTAKERKGNIKLGDKNFSFTTQAYDHSILNPDIPPRFIDLANLKGFLEAVESMQTISRLMTVVTTQLEDTILLVGGEAFSSALSIYKAFKDAASKGVSGAQKAKEEMEKSYPGHKKKHKDDSDSE